MLKIQLKKKKKNIQIIILSKVNLLFQPFDQSTHLSDALSKRLLICFRQFDCCFFSHSFNVNFFKTFTKKINFFNDQSNLRCHSLYQLILYFMVKRWIEKENEKLSPLHEMASVLYKFLFDNGFDMQEKNKSVALYRANLCRNRVWHLTTCTRNDEYSNVDYRIDEKKRCIVSNTHRNANDYNNNINRIRNPALCIQ